MDPMYDPSTDPTNIKYFFLSYHKTIPLVRISGPLNLELMTASLCVFCSTPPTKKNEDYILWLNKIVGKKSKFWKEIGIFDLIQLSRTCPGYFQNMLVAFLYLWESTIDTFQLPCGMLTVIPQNSLYPHTTFIHIFIIPSP